jgi:hypothetical protein
MLIPPLGGSSGPRLVVLGAAFFNAFYAGAKNLSTNNFGGGIIGNGRREKGD